MNGILARVVGWAWPSTSSAGSSEPRRAALLLRGCALVRTGALEEAELLLESGLLEAEDPARLNLLGVLCEKRGRWAEARRHYGRAIRADRKRAACTGAAAAAAARQNLRRWFELDTFGRTRWPLLLGDEEPRLWWLRRGAMNREGGMDIGAVHHDN